MRGLFGFKGGSAEPSLQNGTERFQHSWRDVYNFLTHCHPLKVLVAQQGISMVEVFQEMDVNHDGMVPQGSSNYEHTRRVKFESV